MPRRRQPGADLVGLARPQPRRGDLRRLVLEELEPALQLPRVHRQRRQRGLVRPPRPDRGRHGGPLRPVAAERVEQVALPALVEQPLLVVLAVDLHERPGDRASRAGRDGLVVEAGHGAARAADLADADQRLREPVEERLDARRLRAVPDERRVGPRAEGEARGRRSAGSCRRRSRRSAR